MNTPDTEMMKLAERCEAATGPDREIDAAICRTFTNSVESDDGDFWHGPHDEPPIRVPAFTASLDAAMTLVPEGWRLAALCQRDPWFVRLETDDFDSVTWGKGEDWITDILAGREVTADAASPALALCAAGLKSRISGDGL